MAIGNWTGLGLRAINSMIGGAEVVTDGRGWYDSIPGAYRAATSYTGPREIVWRVQCRADIVYFAREIAQPPRPPVGIVGRQESYGFDHP